MHIYMTSPQSEICWVVMRGEDLWRHDFCKGQLPKYELYLASRVEPYLCIKNETMAPLHVATLTVQRELPKYELYLASRVSTLPLYQE